MVLTGAKAALEGTPGESTSLYTSCFDIRFCFTSHTLHALTAHTHTQTHAHTRTHTHTCTHTHTHTTPHTHHTHNTHTHTHTHAHTHTTHTHNTHTHTHTHTNPHTHTPTHTGMIGYGMAKAAVHQLISSLAQPNSGLPKDSAVVGILP